MVAAEATTPVLLATKAVSFKPVVVCCCICPPPLLTVLLLLPPPPPPPPPHAVTERAQMTPIAR
jgi:hypothetical protein